MIQNGGDSPRSSIQSVLTINRPNKTQEGTYICSASSSTVNVTLQVINGRFALIFNVAVRCLYFYVRVYTDSFEQSFM